MAAIIIEIADAVVSELNSASLSQSFEAVRSYVPVHEIRDLVDLKVAVVPFNIIGNTIDRSGRQMYNYEIYVTIQRMIGIGPLTNDQINAAADPLMILAEEIVDLFNGKALTLAYDPIGVRCVDVKNSPSFAPHHLDEERIFTSEIILGFKVGR